ncbi:uncharacterized protein LOC126830968 [Patella vulgata]|uniref:uncharacterized protein LOC126830968 n=1 Tax=Patella vulgata TaxID=6465 RepID=UPI00217FE4F1|nr:uncharacterized protein LOC126830968 [Patella vulgata]
MPAHCCVPMCNGKGGHKFPLDPVERRRWIQAVKRGGSDWTPSKWSIVCRSHFDSSDYISETKERDQMVNSILKPGAIPHLFAWKRTSLSGSRRRERALHKQQSINKIERLESLSTSENVGNEVEIEYIEEDFTPIEVKSEPDTKDSATQVDMSMRFCARKYMLSSEKFLYYTGLESYDAFMCLFYSFGPVVDELRYFYGTKPKMSTEDQFFLTLVKLRLGRSNFELSDTFEICEKELMNIFITWINFMYFHFKEINWWPSKDLVKFYSPADFKSKFPTTRVVIDGTEIPIQRPKQPIIQQGTFSTYKNRNTVKVLVGVTPGGLVSYVSDAFGGAASDRQICERSCLMNLGR